MTAKLEGIINVTFLIKGIGASNPKVFPPGTDPQDIVDLIAEHKRQGKPMFITQGGYLFLDDVYGFDIDKEQ